MQVDKYQTRKIITLQELIEINPHVPDLQRDIDEERVEEIIHFQEKHAEKYGTFCFIGDIILFDQKIENYSCTIIDGMHRYYAIKNPRIKNKIPDYKIGVNILHHNVGLTIEDAFLLINKAKPVPMYVLDTVRDKTRRDLIDGCKSFLLKTYKPYISKAQHPRSPHFNCDVFISFLQAAPSYIFLTLTYVEKFINYIQFANAYLSQSPSCTSKMKATILAKSEKNGSVSPAYFCVDPHYEWLRSNDIWETFIKNKPINFEDEKTSKKMKEEPKNQSRLSSTVREKLWIRYYGNVLEGLCKCCRHHNIRFSNFEAGHIQSRKEGGSDHIDNLAPICGSCNKSMGTSHMNTYAFEIYEKCQEKSTPFIPVNEWTNTHLEIKKEKEKEELEKCKKE